MKAKVVKTGEIVDVYHESQHGQITNIYKESVLVNGRMWTEEELDLCMEANVAPEKIYVHVRANKELGTTWHGTWIGVRDVEYIRTDAFIEKACEWIREFNNHHYIMRYSDSCEPPLSEVTEWFKNYMKGE